MCTCSSLANPTFHLPAKHLLSEKKRLSHHATIPSGLLDKELVALPTMYCKEAAQSPESYPNAFQNCKTFQSCAACNRDSEESLLPILAKWKSLTR